MASFNAAYALALNESSTWMRENSASVEIFCGRLVEVVGVFIPKFHRRFW